MLNRCKLLCLQFFRQLKKQLGIWNGTKCKKHFRRWYIQENQFVAVERKLDGIDIDDIGNLVDFPRLIFIDEKCGNLN